MAYPSNVGTFTNPNPTDKLNSPSHSSVETAQNTAITEIQTFVGTLSSAVGTLVYDIRSANSSGGGHVQSANKGGTGQTSYTKGDLLVAQSGSVISKLGIGGDGQVLTVDSSQSSGVKWTNAGSGASVSTMIPTPLLPFESGSGNSAALAALSATSSSSMLVGMVKVPYNITANRITISARDVGNDGTQRIIMTMYTENGSSSVFNVVTSQLSSTAQSVMTAIPGASITAGNYYIATTSSVAAFGSVQAYNWTTDNVAVFDAQSGLTTPPDKPILQGLITIPSQRPPSSIATSSIYGTVGDKVLVFRLDE